MSTVKVNTVDKRTGSTLTLGGCGTTVTLGAGATQSGFGRTGTVDWCTTAKTAPFTGVSGKGYFVNTSCGAVTVTLPASPSAGDIIAVQDYAGTWESNNLTVSGNGSNIGGCACNPVLKTSDQSITLVYVDSTRGWQTVNDSTQTIKGATYIEAVGGTITTCGNYKIHTFTADGCFSVSSVGTGPIAGKVDYLVVAGGAGGGSNGYPDGRGTGGGGAGGFRESKCSSVSGSWTASPLASATSLTVTATTYPVTVGGGGGVAPTSLPAYPAGPATNGTSGSDSVFSTITSTGGGFGMGHEGCGAGPGGSGGGTSNGGEPFAPWIGTGNTPPTSPAQGSDGGAGSPNPTSPPWSGGGGGGATAVGGTATAPTAGNGGAGATSSINGGAVARAGGGGGGAGGTAGSGGTGGGGAGSNSPTAATAGTTNTGGGGGGNGIRGGSAGAGGSGIVIIRYKYQ